LPVMLGLTIWAMGRMGERRVVVSFGPPAPIWRHGVLLIAPLITAITAGLFVQATQGVETNILVALTLSSAGLIGWLWLIWRSFAQRGQRQA
jgi:predicted exporter